MRKKTFGLLSLVLSISLLCSFVCVPVYARGDDSGITRISVCVNGDTSTSRGFCWYTEAQTESKVQLWCEDEAVSTAKFSDVRCTEWEGSYMHKVTVSGLEAGKRYTYRVGDGTVWSGIGSFTTDDLDDKVDFIAVADVQASSLENFQKGADTLNAALRQMPEADFVANLGDFTNDSTNEEWDFYDEAFCGINKSITLAPVSGNHDGFGVEYWFDNMFNLDASQSVQIRDGVNYSYDYGNAHFAVLNTNDNLSISNAQLEWLANDMNSTDKDWKIVFMHKSPYSLGKDGKWPDALYLQDSLAAVLDSCNVDLVMSGHDHMYLRTKSLYNNEVSPDGTVYVLAGTAGSKRYEIRSFSADSFLKTEFIDAMVVQKNGYGNYWNGENWDNTADTNIGGCFNCISIDGGTLTLNAYILADAKAADGTDVITKIDTYTVTKELGQNVPSFDGDNTTSETDYILDVIPSFTNLAIFAILEWLPIFVLLIPEILWVYVTEDTF